MLKRIMFISLFVFLALPLMAQEKKDSAYIFRFVPEKDMFYVPYRQNESELQRLCDTLSICMQQLKDEQMYINVSSYATSSTGSIPAGRMAHLRINRVKAELITRLRLKEKMFVTDRVIPHAYRADSLRNIVVVTFPAGVERVAQIAGKEAAMRVLAYNKEVFDNSEAGQQIAEQQRQEEQKLLAAELAEQERLAAQAATTRNVECSPPLSSPARTGHTKSSFSLRANLLSWATLTPDLGLEWRITPNWGVVLNGSWTSWSWQDKDRRYALWRISPEFRYYIGKEGNGYIGAMYHIGEFNYKLAKTGKQGHLQGGGLIGGYLLKMSSCLSLDFTIGLGCTHIDYDRYQVIDEVRVKSGKTNKNYWGVNRLGVTLVWKIVRP